MQPRKRLFIEVTEKGGGERKMLIDTRTIHYVMAGRDEGSGCYIQFKKDQSDISYMVVQESIEVLKRKL